MGKGSSTMLFVCEVLFQCQPCPHSSNTGGTDVAECSGAGPLTNTFSAPAGGTGRLDPF